MEIGPIRNQNLIFWPLSQTNNQIYGLPIIQLGVFDTKSLNFHFYTGGSERLRTHAHKPDGCLGRNRKGRSSLGGRMPIPSLLSSQRGSLIPPLEVG